jgi:small-conductance mechanosensitive channel
LTEIGEVFDQIRQLLETNIPLINVSIFRILVAIIALLIGLAIVKIVVKIFERVMQKKKLPALLREFLARLITAIANIMVILFAVSLLGFHVDSLVLGLSAILGLILAFGMQDTFTNFFAGVWLATLRPIRKDEVVSVAGITGKVSAVGMMATEFHTPDNKFITVPNKLVWGSPIENMSRMPIRRVDVNVGIAYGSTIENAIKVAMRLMKRHKLILKDPAPSVASTELADSSVNLQLRPWSKTDDYWTVKDDILKAVHDEYLKEGIEIPFPQMDVHLTKE